MQNTVLVGDSIEDTVNSLITLGITAAEKFDPSADPAEVLDGVLSSILNFAVKTLEGEYGCATIGDDKNTKHVHVVPGQEPLIENLGSGVRFNLENPGYVNKNVITHIKNSKGYSLGSISMHKNNQDSKDRPYLAIAGRYMATVFENLELLEKGHFNELSYIFTTHVINEAIAFKDTYTLDHLKRTSDIVLDLCYILGTNKKDRRSTFFATCLHDTGKINTPRSILLKEGKLTAEERNTVNKHPEDGAVILEKFFKNGLPPIVREHHERYDGSGYPCGKSGEDIDFSARIIAVADTVDAMDSDRPYRTAIKPDRIYREIMNNSGGQFDPIVTHAFERALKMGETTLGKKFS